MKSNIQNAVKRAFGVYSVRVTGMQMVNGLLPLALLQRLTCWSGSASKRPHERVLVTVFMPVGTANDCGFGGQGANQFDSPAATGQKPGPGFDLASRAGWIAG
jgi:hypothetical protein